MQTIERPAVPDEGLVRAIGLGSAVLLVVGSVVGSGIFLTTGGMAALIPSASLLLIAWALGGVLAITGGLTYAEMGGMFPRSGGVYVFLREAYGGLTAFLYGWASLLVVISGAMAAVAVGFAEYLSYFFPVLSTSNVVLSTAPIYTTTTSMTMLMYGLSEPPLQIGWNYVWRVKAYDLEGRALFRNNGYSAICTFTPAIPSTPTSCSARRRIPRSLTVSPGANRSIISARPSGAASPSTSSP